MTRYYPGILIVILIVAVLDLFVDLGWIKIG